MFTRLGFVDGVKVWSWVKKFECELESEKWNEKENKSRRKCLWFGVGVSLGIKNELFIGKKIDKGLKLVGDKWWGRDDWNSVLLLKYENGVELKPHCDREVFDKKVVVVNVSCDNLFGGNVEFIYGDKIEVLSNGEVVEFNSSVPHGVRKVKNERWSLSFRKVLV